ncbi:MAG TPA: endonuclease domain-containing protein [Allosphingosinicella sp.]|nr:endonuclease domain-containing protein [Allosphingosinicella sp.]
MSKADRNKVVMKARELRRSPTLPESLLWQQLRQRPYGLKFRRQHPFGPFIADFYCSSAHLVVEVDGDSHDMGDRPALDERRDLYLRESGLRVLRLRAADVLKDVEPAISAILAMARA